MCNAVYIISHVTIGKNFVTSILGSPRGIKGYFNYLMMMMRWQKNKILERENVNFSRYSRVIHITVINESLITV